MNYEIIIELLAEKIKREIPSNLGQKLHSFQENRMQWLYYGTFINQEQIELQYLALKAYHGCYSFYDMTSSAWHYNALSGYKNEQVKYFRSMCCDALDIVNELFMKKRFEIYD